MKVLFAVSNSNITDSVVSRYQQKFKEIITSKNVYYFNAIINELQKDKTYDSIVISEDLEPISNNNYEAIDKFILEKMDRISDEASKVTGEDIPIIFICSDRRSNNDKLLRSLFSMSIYNALVGNDRSVNKVCDLINKPRNKKEAKKYYQIENDNEVVDYISQNGKEELVSEAQMQSILSYYKKIGTNEKKCVEAFDRISQQYDQTQLRLIVKMLPMAVKAILEEKSATYQRLMTGGTVLSNGSDNRYNKNINSPKLDFLEKDLESSKITAPVVIPSSINVNENKNTMPSNNSFNQNNYAQQAMNNNFENNQYASNYINNGLTNNINNQPQTGIQNQYNDLFTPVSNQNAQVSINERQANISTDNQINAGVQNQINTEEVTPEPVKRGRGRPRKIKPTETVTKEPKRGRGRPRKVAVEPTVNSQPNPVEENNIQQSNINGMQSEINSNQVELNNIKPEFGNQQVQNNMFDNSMSNQNLQASPYETAVNNVNNNQINNSPYETSINNNSFDAINNNAYETMQNPYNQMNTGVYGEKTNNQNSQMFNSDMNSSFEMNNTNPYDQQLNNNFQNANNNPYDKQINMNSFDNQNQFGNSEQFNNQNSFGNQGQFNGQVGSDLINNSQPQNNFEVNNMMPNTTKGKIVSFVGTTKNGTSFVVNNLAQYISQNNVKVAILDVTQNKNAYYMFTNNDPKLMQVASTSIQNLAAGNINGIKVNNNLTVFTSLPGDLNVNMANPNQVINTLQNNFDVCLIDSDFETDVNYFTQSNEIYLVQTMDAFTIQPLTKFLSSLKSRNILDENKLRVVINKYVKLKRLDYKLIIGGMSKYNEPSMTLQRDLFNPDIIKSVIIPFSEKNYAKYLEEIAMCQLSLNDYTQDLLSALENLKQMVFPQMQNNTTQSNNRMYGNYEKKEKQHKFSFFGKKEKQNVQQPQINTQTQFTNDINDTLNRMRNNNF